jgi:hypothetical protein
LAVPGGDGGGEIFAGDEDVHRAITNYVHYLPSMETAFGEQSVADRGDFGQATRNEFQLLVLRREREFDMVLSFRQFLESTSASRPDVSGSLYPSSLNFH